QMRVRDSMERHTDAVGAERQHLVLIRLRIVDGHLCIRIAGERHRKPFLHERGRLFSLGRSDQIHRADLIIFAPAVPVIEVLLPLLELFPGYIVALGALWNGRDRHHDEKGETKSLSHGVSRIVSGLRGLLLPHWASAVETASAEHSDQNRVSVSPPKFVITTTHVTIKFCTRTLDQAKFSR